MNINVLWVYRAVFTSMIIWYAWWMAKCYNSSNSVFVFCWLGISPGCCITGDCIPATFCWYGIPIVPACIPIIICCGGMPTIPGCIPYMFGCSGTPIMPCCMPISWPELTAEAGGTPIIAGRAPPIIAGGLPTVPGCIPIITGTPLAMLVGSVESKQQQQQMFEQKQHSFIHSPSSLRVGDKLKIILLCGISSSYNWLLFSAIVNKTTSSPPPRPCLMSSSYKLLGFP